VRKNFLEKQDFTSRSIRVLKRTGTSRVSAVDSYRWPVSGTLSGGILRPRGPAQPAEMRCAVPQPSSGGFAVALEGHLYTGLGLRSGDVLFLAPQVPSKPGDLMLVDGSSGMELRRADVAAAPGRAVAIGVWRALHAEANS
jgi:hypothetical protein